MAVVMRRIVPLALAPVNNARPRPVKGPALPTAPAPAEGPGEAERADADEEHERVVPQGAVLARGDAHLARRAQRQAREAVGRGARLTPGGLGDRPQVARAGGRVGELGRRRIDEEDLLVLDVASAQLGPRAQAVGA